MSGLKYVFCEGGDDVKVVTCLANLIGRKDLRVEPFSGTKNLGNFLGQLQQRPEFAQGQVGTIAVVRDADENAAAALQSVRDSLRQHGYAVPDSNGGIAGEPIRVGILVIGPNQGQGMVEDLCLESVKDQPEFACVESFADCIARQPRQVVLNSKARLRVWLACQQHEDVRVGLAAEKGYWSWDHPAFEPLKRFLLQL